MSVENQKALSGISVTLGVAGAVSNLYVLLKAIDPKCPPVCREANIQFDPIQAGANGYLLIGDSSVDDSPQRCGVAIPVGNSYHYGAGAEVRQIYLNNIYLVATGMDGMVVNVDIQN